MKSKPISVVFLICWVYWGYLSFASQMSIKFDAADYEFIGRLIYEKGWLEFFKTGPHREPLYPLVIAVSMRMADSLSIPYQTVQKGLQVLILFVTQLFVLDLLGRLKVREGIKWLTLLYIGFSPAIVNSTFSLFAEIITYPFVLAIVSFGVLSWRAVFGDGSRRLVALALLTALSFVLATFGKGVFHYVLWLYLIVFAAAGCYAQLKANSKVLWNSLSYCVVVLLTFHMFIIPFKLANQRYNGNYVFTNRFADLLFGNAVKRSNPLSARMIFAHLASVPGAGICRVFFTEEECRYCEFQMADYYRSTLLEKLKHNTSQDKVTAEVISRAIQKTAENPAQYVLLTFMESLRMPFWESTQLGNVVYPAWLQKLYDFVWFKNFIRLLMSLATYFSFFYLLQYVVRNRAQLTDFKSAVSERAQMCFFILFLVMSYTALHSLFSIVTRYALPISFLYLLGIAFFLEQRLLERGSISKGK